MTFTALICENYAKKMNIEHVCERSTYTIILSLIFLHGIFSALFFRSIAVLSAISRGRKNWHCRDSAFSHWISPNFGTKALGFTKAKSPSLIPEITDFVEKKNLIKCWWMGMTTCPHKMAHVYSPDLLNVRTSINERQTLATKASIDEINGISDVWWANVRAFLLRVEAECLLFIYLFTQGYCRFCDENLQYLFRPIALSPE